MADLAALYLRAPMSVGAPSARLLTRVESGPLWSLLRASGECGLTPDERAVALALLNGRGHCRLLTDFAEEESVARVYGRKRYFETGIDFGEAESTLRTVGERASRNSYLLGDNVLGLRRRQPLSKLAEAFGELGEWCFFTSQQCESSNC